MLVGQARAQVLFVLSELILTYGGHRPPPLDVGASQASPGDGDGYSVLQARHAAAGIGSPNERGCWPYRRRGGYDSQYNDAQTCQDFFYNILLRRGGKEESYGVHFEQHALGWVL